MAVSGKIFLIVFITLVAFSGETLAWDRLCGRTLADMLSLVCHGRGYYTDVTKQRTRLTREAVFQDEDEAHKFFGGSAYGERTQRRRGSGLIVVECCENSCDYSTVESYCAPWPKDMDPALRFAGFKFGSWEDEDYYRKYHPEEFEMTTWAAPTTTEPTTSFESHTVNVRTTTSEGETTSESNASDSQEVVQSDRNSDDIESQDFDKDNNEQEDYSMNEDRMSRKHKKAKRLQKERKERKSRGKTKNYTKPKSVLSRLVENIETASPSYGQAKDDDDDRWWMVEDPQFEIGDNDGKSSGEWHRKPNGNSTKGKRRRKKGKADASVVKGRQERSSVRGHQERSLIMNRQERRTRFSIYS
ncbi:uncharacterized protein LOC144453035 [Glandiceps talaboti]